MIDHRYNPLVLKIGSVLVDPPLVLAPMAGLTDSPFRQVIREVGGCGLVTMEFLSSEALTRDIKVEKAKIPFHACERPISMQVYGSRPKLMAEAARMVQDAGAEICDVNMGCPANKILKGCSGAALMSNLAVAGEIIREIRSAISIPLTVKFRIGIRHGEENFLELGRICEEEGVDAVALHGRTAKQQYSGIADWTTIKELKESLPIPVIGNGDVKTPEDAVRMFAETGCDAVMIGRASLRNPWIFAQTAALLDGGSYEEPTVAQRHAFVRRHFELLNEAFEEKAILHKFKTFTGWYCRGLRGARHLRRSLGIVRTSVELMDEVDRFFEDEKSREEAVG